MGEKLQVLMQNSGNSGLINRNEIEKKHTWNLEDIYESNEKWEEDFKFVSNSVCEYKKFEDVLSQSAENIYNCFQFDDSIGIIIGKLNLYAMLSKDLDLTNTTNHELYDRITALSSKVSAASSFIRPYLLEIEESILLGWIKNHIGLNTYSHLIDDLIRTKKHTLNKREEELLALAGPALNNSEEVFSMFNNADIDFPEVEDENGNLQKVSHGRYTAAMYSTNREYRERVYRAMYKPFMQSKNTLCTMFSGNIKSLVFLAKARAYQSTRAASLDANKIPLEVYDNLVATAMQNTYPLHRWAQIKMKVLGISDFHAYDTYVTLFPSVKKEYSYEKGVEILLEALKPLGTKYIKDVQYALENRWIDVYETKSKRSGAYSSGTTFGVHPYVLLNWNNQLNDVFTLAHEMGHNMHSYYTGKKQPFTYANYSIFVAEVASIMNESLLLDYLIKNASSKEEKLSLIEIHINNLIATFYRQTGFAYFEQKVHELVENEEALTPDKLCDIYGNLYTKLWGSEMIVDKEETFTWARVPHFYYNFYVYQYATSFAASEVLSQKVLSEGDAMVQKYLAFLESGNSDYPINILKNTGVDMTSPEVITGTIGIMNKLIDEIEGLL